jgi:hypothetical protein
MARLFRMLSGHHLAVNTGRWRGGVIDERREWTTWVIPQTLTCFASLPIVGTVGQALVAVDAV